MLRINLNVIDPCVIENNFIEFIPYKGMIAIFVMFLSNRGLHMKCDLKWPGDYWEKYVEYINSSLERRYLSVIIFGFKSEKNQLAVFFKIKCVG